MIIMRTSEVVIVAIVLALATSGEALCSGLFDPLILVWAGEDMPGYGEALAEIIESSGTRVMLVREESTFRGLVNLPQVRCVVLGTFTPTDFGFLQRFAPVLERHFDEGGSFVGIGPVCSELMLGSMARTIFPVEGNASGRGNDIGGIYGSTYVLSDPIETISGALPTEFALTQSQYIFRSGLAGPIEPASEYGRPTVVYRARDTGAPMVVALERDDGGRSVSLPGCYVAKIERLPYYWDRLLSQPEFKELLVGSISWAMEGSRRYEELGLASEERLKEEAERISELRRSEQGASRASENERTLLLAGLWMGGIILQAVLVKRYLLPRLRAARARA